MLGKLRWSILFLLNVTIAIRGAAVAEPGFTMMVATYKRDDLLQPLLRHLTTSPPPSLRAIILIWQNVGSPLPAFLLPEALADYSGEGVNISVRISVVNSMNERFRPILGWGERIKTEAVMIMDDDVILRKEALEWGYQAYLEANPLGSDSNQGRLTGFAGRDFRSLGGGEWLYVLQPRESYSMVLSNAAWLRREWLEKYWDSSEEMKELRDYVDKVFNCDDLLINYIVSNLTGRPPLLLQPLTPLRTIPTVGLWNRGEDDPESDLPASTSSPSPSTSSATKSAPVKLDHFAMRAVCLGHYFSHFAFHAPRNSSSSSSPLHYPLIRTSSAVSQNVVDRARWLYSLDEPWEEANWLPPAPPPAPSDDENEDEPIAIDTEFFQGLIGNLQEDEIDELHYLLSERRVRGSSSSTPPDDAPEHDLREVEGNAFLAKQETDIVERETLENDEPEKERSGRGNFVKDEL